MAVTHHEVPSQVWAAARAEDDDRRSSHTTASSSFASVERSRRCPAVADGSACAAATQPWRQHASSYLKVSEETVETAKLLAAGGVAGAVSKSVTAPLARLTILFQVQGLQPAGGAAAGARARAPLPRGGTLQALSYVVRNEGVRALWKGNGVTIIHRLPYSSINFWAYERLTEHLSELLPSDPTTDVARRLGAGGVAGMTACAISYPLDLVRTRLAAQTTEHYYRGIWHTLRTIVADEGAAGLYRGLGATLMQVGPSLAINYCTYETLRSYAVSRQQDKRAPSVGASLLCGSVAGLVSSTATFPLDLVRRRMQLVGQHGQCSTRYHRYGDVLRDILRREGVRGLYSGIVPEYLKVVPGVAIAFCTYECAKATLGVQANAYNR